MADNAPIVTVRGVAVRAGETLRVGAMVFDVAEDANPGDTLYYIDGALRHWVPAPRPPAKTKHHHKGTTPRRLPRRSQ
jgi:hypothetical protein